MLHPHFINILHAVILLATGITAYFISSVHAPYAALAIVTGLVLLACTHHLKRRNQFVLNTVTAITLITAIVYILHIEFDSLNLNSADLLYLIIGISSFLAATCYIISSRNIKRSSHNKA